MNMQPNFMTYEERLQIYGNLANYPLELLIELYIDHHTLFKKPIPPNLPNDVFYIYKMKRMHHDFYCKLYNILIGGIIHDIFISILRSNGYNSDETLSTYPDCFNLICRYILDEDMNLKYNIPLIQYKKENIKNITLKDTYYIFIYTYNIISTIQ